MARQTETSKRMTRAQKIRAGKLAAKNGKMAGYERKNCFQFNLLISRKEEVNGVVTVNLKREREIFIRLEAAEHFVKSLGKGYKLEIKHNPKKWLTGEKSIRQYDMCERVEKVVKEYNAK